MEKDTIVVADFANSTGDVVFDDTLKQGLAIALEQSPFLNILSGEKVNETLKLMGRSPDERLTPDVAREVCQREGANSTVDGRIASLGSHYVISLDAVDCHTGAEIVARSTSFEADGEETVLKAFDKATASLRGKLGESAGSVKEFNRPLEDATTPSLDALKFFAQSAAALMVKNLDRFHFLREDQVRLTRNSHLPMQNSPTPITLSGSQTLRWSIRKRR